jgi:hypothetical protein
VRPSLEIKNLPFQKKRTYSFHTIRALFSVRLSAAVSHKYHPPNEFYSAPLNNFIL